MKRNVDTIIKEYKRKKSMNAIKTAIAAVIIIMIACVNLITVKKGIVTSTTKNGYSEILYIDGNIHIFKDTDFRKYDFVSSVFFADVHICTEIIGHYQEK